jgi:6-phosphogluconolactonase (cycloisomerase 2 family)
MIVSNEHFPTVLDSDVSSYDVTRSGNVTPIDTEPANAGGACWNVIVNNDKFVLVTSPFTLNINSFRIERNGQLSPVNGDSVVATAQGLTLDEALSNDSKYLYVLVDEPTGFAFSQVNAYKVNKDGTITLLGTTAPFEGSSSGAAAW